MSSGDSAPFDGLSIDQTGLMTAVARLAWASTTDFVAEGMLSELCHAAADALDVDGVGVMAVDGTRTRFVNASHPGWEPFEMLQQVLQAGPCRDAVNTQRPVTADTPERIADQWGTAFADSAATNNIQAVLAVPLVSRGRCWGTLDLYWKHQHTPSDAELDAAVFLADVAVSYLVMASDRDEARIAREQLAHQVLHDQLTGLPNRQLITELIQHALNTARRRRTRVAVLFIDIDKFKQINDRYGHLAGDLVLTDVASRLTATIRAGDAAGRLGGDEFLILCEDLPADETESTGSLVALTQRLLSAISAPLTIGDHTLRITASVGAAVAHGVTDDLPLSPAADVIHRADLAMYQHKNKRVTRTGEPGQPTGNTSDGDP